ncbi:MAG: 2Fe-2S iron-sulfur cluster-binding protein, partial [Cryomorphaceae bacterium]
MMLLVSILLYARKKLTPQGDVTMTLNDKDITVSPGNTILSTLSNNGVFLPSACGGGGTCGMCTCQVLEGGGSILPTETGFFTRKEQQNNWRLGCQVKIREDIKIR